MQDVCEEIIQFLSPRWRPTLDMMGESLGSGKGELILPEAIAWLNWEDSLTTLPPSSVNIHSQLIW